MWVGSAPLDVVDMGGLRPPRPPLQPAPLDVVDVGGPAAPQTPASDALSFPLAQLDAFVWQ